MRKLLKPVVGCVIVVALTFTIEGCRRDEKIKLEETDESTPALAAMVHAADPKAALQLTRGFHSVEQNSWRWTMGSFAVALRPPAGAAENGATLTAKLSMPEAVLNKVKRATLTASIQKKPIGSHQFTSPGEVTFKADVPAELLKNETVTVEFELDQFLPAGSVDNRELGLVFLSAALESK